ncbi:hypothetical protein [Undibacterium sp.]|jgi:hypothetical protein|uniref:hypothetical protein n=1 Tax=Undibacterium sp. TaxID=1914977 RepID=UPI002C9F6517|nr:hypothetical protein [Undibacterium sp.]HTD05698.1 hypothetical protein [Undibacterium sp.]
MPKLAGSILAHSGDLPAILEQVIATFEINKFTSFFENKYYHGVSKPFPVGNGIYAPYLHDDKVVFDDVLYFSK